MSGNPILRTLAVAASAALLVTALAVPATAGPAEYTLTAGGQIVQGDYKVSFGGSIKESADFESGQFQVNFHNVSDPDVVGGRFHSTAVPVANWFAPDSDTCEAAMNVSFEGRFNGEDNHQLIFRAGDNDDTVRIQLLGGPTYDTHDGDFDDESSCVGGARTGLDRGNVKITLAD